MTSTSDTDIISISGSNSDGKCGYCKNISSNKSSYGIICDNMKPETYFHLMNRGWRRCGTHFYKPHNENTCCPLYTIRCDATNFELSKSQRKVLKKFRKFLLLGKEGFGNKDVTEKINARGDEVLTSNNNDISIKSNVNSRNMASTVPIDKSKKAKTIRYNRKLEKLKFQATKENKPFEELFSSYKLRHNQRIEKQKPKTLCQYMDFSDLIDPKHFLEIKTIRCHPESKSFSDTKKAEHKVYMKYQCSVHHDSPSEVNMHQFERFLVNGGLYHNKTSDIIDLKHTRRDLPQGQYHQQYWLNGTHLIAVGVIDLVGQALSSVYLFYDPDFAFLDLGIFSALLEIDFVNQLRRAYDDSDFRFYYMGFYTHECVKMKYKAQYHGSELLCPVVYSWVPVKVCQLILNGTKFSRFSEASQKDQFTLENKPINQLVTQINVLVSGRSYKLKRFQSQLSPEFLAILEELARLVGARILPNLKIRLM